MFNDNACFGNIRIKIRPGGKCLCLSFKFHKSHVPRSFCIKCVIKRRERRVRAITSARLGEDGHLTVRPLGREFGSEVPSNLSGSSGPLSAGGWGMAGTRHLPGRAPGAAAEVTGRLCSPVPRSKHGHGHGPGNGLWENATSCNCTVEGLPRASGHRRDSSPLLLPQWVPAEPRDANAELKHNPFPGVTLGLA